MADIAGAIRKEILRNLNKQIQKQKLMKKQIQKEKPKVKGQVMHLGSVRSN